MVSAGSIFVKITQNKLQEFCGVLIDNFLRIQEIASSKAQETVLLAQVINKLVSIRDTLLSLAAYYFRNTLTRRFYKNET